jgi:exodeoxyribonuclease VII small subunit
MSEKSFEQSLERLQEIVARLEEGEMALEDSLELFEEGMKLSRNCSSRLEAAEQRIKVLLKRSDSSDDEVPYEGAQSE